MKNSKDHNTVPTSTSSQYCVRCGAPMRCEISEGKSTCWCFNLPSSGLSTADVADAQGCLCKECLSQLVASKHATNNTR
ncbi:MAG: cysteine-rich CWC family protein [Hahellaceae bacterium]|nr:cysteine-rich CWC family protein [Hahellaceae bacterium]MCP5170520.1 cysteine-rich CWC family protein [Hahellaceae bacterium]